MIKETKGINQKKNFEIFNNQVFNHSYHTKKLLKLKELRIFAPCKNYKVNQMSILLCSEIPLSASVRQIRYMDVLEVYKIMLCLISPMILLKKPLSSQVFYENKEEAFVQVKRVLS